MNETAVRIAGFSDLDESKMCYWYQPGRALMVSLDSRLCGLANR
jgi:hypothetical protein